MKTRIIKNWRNSLLGLALLVMSSALLCLRAITFTEYAIFFPTILGLLYVQDSVFKVNSEKQENNN
ncbi:MAG: hypothetical protein M0P47_11510 [Bacteroidales bacterium]|nr:hypothetical protein [Bacteroidales bacterium]